MRGETIAIACVLAAGGLAGCVKAIPDEIVEACEDPMCGECYASFTVAVDCCAGCVPPPTPAPAPHSWGSPCEANLSFMTCVYPVPAPLPPLIEEIVPRLVDADCGGCAHVSLASDGLRAFVVSEERLVVVGDAMHRAIALPARLERPHVALALDGRAWIVGIDRALPIPHVRLLAYDGGSSFALDATLEALGAPVVLATERAWIAPTANGAMVVLATEDGAWSVPYARDAGFGAVEPLTPLAADARVGPPAVDARGRVVVPYALMPRDVLAPASALFAPAASLPALHVAQLGRDGAWTHLGGIVVPQGVAEAPVAELAQAGVGAMVFVDRSGVLHRLETWDGGASWGAPVPWSGAYDTVVRAPAVERADPRTTVAWWTEGDGLVVARSDGGGSPLARAHVATSWSGGDAALALLADGRAVVAWVDEEGAVWAGVEGGSFPASLCDDAAHCGRGHPLRW